MGFDIRNIQSLKMLYYRRECEFKIDLKIAKTNKNDRKVKKVKKVKDPQSRPKRVIDKDAVILR